MKFIQIALIAMSLTAFTGCASKSKCCGKKEQCALKGKAKCKKDKSCCSKEKKVGCDKGGQCKLDKSCCKKKKKNYKEN